jgi:hypothetical protein
MTNGSVDSHALILFSSLKWLAVVLLVFAWTSSWADNKVQPPKSSGLIKTTTQVANPTPATSAVTTFVDGPTGYVFVYTAEGWKFVRSTKN